MLALRRQFPRPIPEHIKHAMLQREAELLPNHVAQAADATEQQDVLPGGVEARPNAEEAHISQVRGAELAAGMSAAAPRDAAENEGGFADFPMDTDEDIYHFDFSSPQWRDRWDGMSDTSDVQQPPPTETSGSVASYESTAPRAAIIPPTDPRAHPAPAFPQRRRLGAPPHGTSSAHPYMGGFLPPSQYDAQGYARYLPQPGYQSGQLQQGGPGGHHAGLYGAFFTRFATRRCLLTDTGQLIPSTLHRGGVVPDLV